MGDLTIGSHDTGIWDRANPVKVKSQPSKSDLEPAKALAEAKASPGAELIIVSKQGKASIHSLSIEKQWGEDQKKVDVKQLSPKRVPDDMEKTPLVIDQDPAYEFNGEYAFIVDDKNQVGMPGDFLTKTQMSKALTAFFEGKADVAYLLTEAAAQKPKVLDALIANEIGRFVSEGQLSVAQASRLAEKLRDPGIKAQLLGLLQQAAGVESGHQTRMHELDAGLKNRSGQLAQQVQTASGTLQQAESKWDQRHGVLQQQVDKAQTALNEARVPGITDLESRQSQAQTSSEKKQASWSQASQRKQSDEYRLRQLEGVPREVSALRDQLSRNRQDLDSRKDQLVRQFSTSLALKQTEIAAIGIGSLFNDEGMSPEDRRRIDTLQTQMIMAQQVLNELRIWNRNSPSTLTQILGNLSMDFFDALSMNMYVHDVQGMERTINQTESALRSKESQAAELPQAREAFAAANRQEASSASELQRANEQLTGVNAEIASRRAKALPDTAPAVKSAQTALGKAQQRFAAEVGDQGSLTTARNEASTQYRQLKGQHDDTVRGGQADIRKQLGETRQTLARQLTGKWNEGVHKEFQGLQVELPAQRSPQ